MKKLVTDYRKTLLFFVLLLKIIFYNYKNYCAFKITLLGSLLMMCCICTLNQTYYFEVDFKVMFPYRPVVSWMDHWLTTTMNVLPKVGFTCSLYIPIVFRVTKVKEKKNHTGKITLVVFIYDCFISNIYRFQLSVLKVGGCLFRFYSILTFVGYWMPNPFLYKLSVLIQTIQFSVSTVSMSKSSISNNSV